MSSDDTSSTIHEPGSLVPLAGPEPQLEQQQQPNIIGPQPLPNATSTSASQYVKNHILSPEPFADTFAILMLILHLPVWLTVLIDCTFIHFLSPSFSWREIWRPFRFISSAFGGSNSSSTSTSSNSNQSSNTTQSQSSYKKNQPSLFKVLIIDFICAITTLYLTPILKKVVIVFAHAIVASSVGGGQRTFLNAIYATSIVELVTFFWDIICDFFHIEHTYTDLVTSSSPRFLRYSSHISPAMTSPPFSALMDESTQTFNTLTSFYKLFPTLFRFICHIDWYSEFPSLIVQMIAVYVIWLGLSPFLRGELASSLASDSEPPLSQSAHTAAPQAPAGSNITLVPTAPTVAPSQPQPPDFSVESFEETIDIGTSYADSGIRSVVVISVPKEAAEHSGSQSEDLSSLGNSNSGLGFFSGNSGKKNKKAALVRSNQPLWSTLANSIVMSARQEHMPNVPPQPHQKLDPLIRDRQASIGEPKTGPSGCYASYVFEKVVGFFVTGVFTGSLDSYIVRVNQVQWRQTVIKLVNVSDSSITVKPDEATDESGSTVIDVSNTYDTILITVHGLTGGTVYEMEILQVHPDSSYEDTIGRIKICTAPADTNSRQPIAPPSRPLSPVTTLLDTLSQSQVTLSEVKNSIKRSRKDHAKKMSTIRHEIDQIRSKCESNDKTDERVRRKLLSFKSTVKQLEADIKAAEEESKHLEQKAKDYADGYTALKNEWKQQMEILEERKKAEQKAREEFSMKLDGIEAEKSAINAKREKLLAKKERLTSDISKIESDLDQAIQEELGRRKAAREAKMERRKKLVNEFSDAITQMENGVKELKSRTQNNYSTYQNQVQSNFPQLPSHLDAPGGSASNVDGNESSNFTNLNNNNNSSSSVEPNIVINNNANDFEFTGSGVLGNGFFGHDPTSNDKSNWFPVFFYSVFCNFIVHSVFFLFDITLHVYLWFHDYKFAWICKLI